MLPGAIRSFRRAALAELRHAARYRAASLGEGIDLCWSLVGRGGRLAIATDAPIVHNKAPGPANLLKECLIISSAFLDGGHGAQTLATVLARVWFPMRSVPCTCS